MLRLYDDGDTEREGQQRYKLDRHNDAINYVDFRLEHKITASASDDGQLLLYNHHSHRVDGELSPPDITDLPDIVNVTTEAILDSNNLKTINTRIDIEYI